MREKFFNPRVALAIFGSLLLVYLAVAATIPNMIEIPVKPTELQIRGYEKTWRVLVAPFLLSLAIAQTLMLALRRTTDIQARIAKWKWIVSTCVHAAVTTVVLYGSGWAWSEISMNPILLAAIGNWVHQGTTLLFTPKGNSP